MTKRNSQRPAYDDAMLTHGVIAILLITFAIVTALSFFGRAGTVGVILNEWILSFLFGSMRYFVPIVIVVLAWYIVADVKYDYRKTHGIGAVLFFVATSSVIHLRYPADEMWLNAVEGRGGGIFGMLAWVLQTYVGTVASWVILIASIAISLLLLFNTSIMHLFKSGSLSERFAPVRKKMENARNDMDDDEETADTDEWDDEDEEEDETAHEDNLIHEDETEDEMEEHDDASNENEDEDDDRADVITGKQRVTHRIDVDIIPAWQKNAVIKPIPPLSLLQNKKERPNGGDIKQSQKIIKDTLREFRINVSMEDVRIGPTVTQFSLKPASGVKLTRITGLSNDLALALAAHPIRIEAPIPGKALVGIEVPNHKTAMVSLRELIESQEFKERKHDMMIGLGKDVSGKVWFADLPRMPHLLIAGSTGSGKTVCMNTIITSLLYQNTAETLRMIMIDPKRVELTVYNGIPHLLTPVITNVGKTVNALKWTIAEMDRRFEVLSRAGNRNITSYNEKHPDQKMPHILFIIDELADLMATASGDVEAGIIRLAQMARAVGIHLIVATQRPSVDVITGLMKANIPGRIAFSVASITDSRTILDTQGADKLIGKGDMLLLTSDFPKPVRIQGAFISESETKRVIKYLKAGVKPNYDESIVEKQGNGGTMNMFGGSDDDTDDMFNDAKKEIIASGKASASFLQRKLKIGYARAARILDELEEAGVIGPAKGAKPREILMTNDEIESSMDAGGEYNVYRDHDTDDDQDWSDDDETDEDDMENQDNEQEDTDNYEEEDDSDEDDEKEDGDPEEEEEGDDDDEKKLNAFET
ncbi:MAG: cell division protein FtsK [Candidatus Magasanikbacteria bacterium CG10_big_fil_rev_8_21_14_0_10_47_10]|uniref:Cell division protein FtsK n=1 Tax=Candidatus Magasanikbacteria bacterium CG10_big_fil_rev_8_21_14_0_10_47_10 TaxID=1974652 RepID=A0A2H0TQT4_9BACT|nr:MAG: cell division protein FtsK [Candidatus Magasanikbacteria bacterium CG10_big_fil_rev_8_21_14_0_10_47_10]